MLANFYLGAHMPVWLERTDAPLFISRVRLARRKRLPVARGRWALDSGGFSELSKHGRWTITAPEYVAEVRRYAREIGGLDWAAAMDWMCEPHIVAKTGLTVDEHQRRTVANYLELCELAPEIPWVPVVQGWTFGDYMRCVDLYADEGVDLASLPLVGVGSVCRRQAAQSAGMHALAALAADGIRCHGFGLKLTGLKTFEATGVDLASADSMAWSFHARREGNGAQNSLDFALGWRDDLLAGLDGARRDATSPFFC